MNKALRSSFLFLMFCTSSTCLIAEPKPKPNELDELAHDISIKNRRRSVVEDRLLLSGKWLTAGSNFAKLFTESNGADRLLEWTVPVTPGYFPENSLADRKKEYVEATQRLRDEDRNDYFVRILVPHPKYAEMAWMDVLPAFSNQQPPKLKVTEMHEIEIHGRKAMRYLHKDGECSILIKSIRGATIQLLTKNYRNAGKLEALANMLDLERLHNKLDS